MILWKAWLPLGTVVGTGGAFRPMSYDDIIDSIELIKLAYPDCLRVYDALEEYPDLLEDSTPESLVCSAGTPCQQLVIEIGDVKHSSNPQVLLSGAVHGDERPGPVAVVETVRLICEGVTGLTFSDRSLIVLPFANAWGYWNINRTEDGIDPNRDFPYDKDPSLTLKSMASKLVNEIFSNAGNVQSGITFHAGVSSISYPWGSPNHMGDIAPDKVAMEQISLEMQKISGKNSRSEWNYEVGDMNTVVYPVTGGMEDWAYSLGFEISTYCSDSTLDIPTVAVPLICENSLPSASIFLVEASDEKSLPLIGIGSREDVWDGADSIPLIPRLIRMSLRVIDLVMPRARIVPMNVEGSIALTVGGCQQVSISDYICDGVPAGMIFSHAECTQELFLLPKDLITCNQVTLSVTFDDHWASDSGYLEYTKKRNAVLKEDPRELPTSTCVIFDNLYRACVSQDHLYIHPGFIRYKPAVYIGHKAIASNITDSITPISILAADIAGNLTIESYDKAVRFTAEIYTSNDAPSNDSSIMFVWILLASLLVPAAGLITYAIWRRGRDRYGMVSSTPRQVA